jgi:hypothetical protein
MAKTILFFSRKDMRASLPATQQEIADTVFHASFNKEDVENAIVEAGGAADAETVAAFIAENQDEFYSIEENMIREGNEGLADAVENWLECRKNKRSKS